MKSLDETESEMRISAWSSVRSRRGGAPLMKGGAPLVVTLVAALAAPSAALPLGLAGLAAEWRRPAVSSGGPVSSGGALLRRPWMRRQALAKSEVAKARC